MMTGKLVMLQPTNPARPLNHVASCAYYIGGPELVGLTTGFPVIAYL